MSIRCNAPPQRFPPFSVTSITLLKVNNAPRKAYERR